MKRRDVAIRFAFGAVISLIAGAVGVALGPRAGGLFLAFPAIMPASLTLIEEEESRHKADRNATGAILGAIALGAFAVVANLTLGHAPVVVALVAATATWVAVALVAYVTWAGVRRVLRGSSGGGGRR